MDNLKTAVEQMIIVRDVFDDKEQHVTLDNLISVASFYVLYDIAENLRILADQTIRANYK